MMAKLDQKRMLTGLVIGTMLVLALLAGWSKFSRGNHHTSEIAGCLAWRR